MGPLELVGLTPLMDRGAGRPETRVALIDGPVALDHADLATESIREVPGGRPRRCEQVKSVACGHGTFVAGILHGRRGSPAPAICPGCTLLVRAIFNEADPAGGLPEATPGELAAALVDCIAAGARVINLSLALARPAGRAERALGEALDLALGRGVLVVAAAGNQGAVGGSAITGHPWVVPVAACDLSGRPAGGSNLGASIGRRGLSAPGEGVTSLGASGGPIRSGGTSAAAAFVTGAAALLLSAFPRATAAQVKLALARARGPRRPSVVPALLDAGAAYRALAGALS